MISSLTFETIVQEHLNNHVQPVNSNFAYQVKTPVQQLLHSYSLGYWFPSQKQRMYNLITASAKI